MKKVAEKASILVLDDEERQREILSLLLEDAGYEVTAIGSAKEALEIVKKNKHETARRSAGLLGIPLIELLPLAHASPAGAVCVHRNPGLLNS